MYVQFTWCFKEDVKELKAYVIEQILLNNNMLKDNKKYIKTRFEIIPNLTINFGSLLLTLN